MNASPYRSVIQGIHRHRATAGRLICLGVIAMMGMQLLAGCASKDGKTQAEKSRDRQEQALRDPYGYGGQLETHDISGGDIGHFDRDAFQKDMDDLFNP